MVGKGLVTFGLWGNDEMYSFGAIRNCQIWRQSGFDVDCRFYVPENYNKITIDSLLEEGAQVITVPNRPEDLTATFWRFQAFGDAEGYDYILSRDVDSRPWEREWEAIDEWLKFGYPVHCIRDHPFHAVPMLAGLFGARKSVFERFAERIPLAPPDDFYKEVNGKYKKDFTSNDFYQVDQHWLRWRVYYFLRNLVMSHDEFFTFERRRYRRFLPRSEDGRFIGEGFNEFDEPRYPEHREVYLNYPRR